MTGQPRDHGARMTEQGEHDRLGRRAGPALARRRSASLLLSTQGGDIDRIVAEERIAILRVFLVAGIGHRRSCRFLLAGTIANPLRKLAEAAVRVRRGVKSRE